MRHALFSVDELEPGGARSVSIGEVEILVVRDSEGKFYAIRDRCPHRGARLSLGVVQYKLVASDVGEYVRSNELVVGCGRHGVEFSLVTGRCPADPEHERVKSYQVSVEEGMVVIDR